MEGRHDNQGISTEQVLQVLRYYSADELRGEQKKLTSAANQLTALVGGKMTDLFTRSELETISRAAELVRVVGLRVEHAKEIRAREEKRQRLLHDERNQRIAETVHQLIPKPAYTPQALLYLAELSMILREENIIVTYLSVEQLTVDILQSCRRAMLCEDHQLRYAINQLYADIEQGVENFLYGREGKSESEELRVLLELVRERREGVLRRYATLFDQIRTLLAIAAADNVEQLPVKRGMAGR